MFRRLSGMGLESCLVPGPFELVGDVPVIIVLGEPLEFKAYTGAYMLLVAVPC